RAASISSITQKGVGWTFRMEKYSAMATKAFSPPDSREMVLRVFPGGWALISMPQPRMSSSSSSSNLAVPPPKSSWKVVWKLSDSSLNCSAKILVISSVISPMMFCSSPL
ncbi:PadR family transcriptional regulator, partial [Dysosmobacter welbionis]